MRTRRLFWLGAALLLSVAALVAIAAVLTGHFGRTQARILGTVGLLFACGSTVLAGRACLERRAARPLAWAAIVLAPVAFAYWCVGVWTAYESDLAGRVAGILAYWVVALLLGMTGRLLLRDERLHWLWASTAVGALAAAAAASVLVARDSPTGWQAAVVPVILVAAGWFLLPILQRFRSAADRPAERLLGTLGAVDVVAVPGDARSVRVGDETVRLRDDETVVVRERA